jgi:iron complex transport system substrate-binding protein
MRCRLGFTQLFNIGRGFASLHQSNHSLRKIKSTPFFMGPIVKYGWIIASTVLAVLVASLILKGRTDDIQSTAQQAVPGDYARIISMAPGITESLFALGLGDRIVGVTDYCDYPAEALAKAKVGGLYNMNFEAMLRQGPDLVICYPEHAPEPGPLRELGLNLLVVKHKSISDILDYIASIGRICSVESVSVPLLQDIRGRMEQLKQSSNQELKVLICIGHDMESSSIENAYFVGIGGFFNEMIELTGAVNAYQGTVPFPVISAEGILSLNPDIIIDMTPDLMQDETFVHAQWQSLGRLKAVQHQHVHVFTDDFVVIPGPRLILTLEKIAQVMRQARENQ